MPPLRTTKEDKRVVKLCPAARQPDTPALAALRNI